MGAVDPHAAQDPPASLLVGRERELGILRERFALALAGQGGLVLIGGEAGIGKTALAETLCREAQERGALVLVGHCYDLSETPPYGPWVDLFAHFQPFAGLALPDAFARSGTVAAVTSQAALFQQVLDFLATIGARCPIVLLLDDLHWADTASLDLLRFVARSVRTLPILLVVAYRSEEVTRRHPLYALLPTLVHEGSPARLDLRPLDGEAQRTLVGDRYRLDPTEAARLTGYLQGRAEGNPFFLGELLRTLEEGRTLYPTGDGWVVGDLRQVRIPLLLRQVIDGRLSRLAQEARELLSIAAVIGHEVPLDLWMTVAACAEDVLLALVEQVLEARLLSEGASGNQMWFTHALIREAIYEGIPAIDRRRLHRRVGEALAAARTLDPDAIAFHFQRADDERALPWLLKAGYRAQASYAWTTAVARFEAALTLMAQSDPPQERGWLMARASRLLQFADVLKARAFADEAVALALDANDRALAAFARFQRGLLACHAGDVGYGRLEIEAAAEAMAALSSVDRARYTAYAPGIGPASRVPDGRGPVVMWRAHVGLFFEARILGERFLPEVAAGDDAVIESLKEGLWGLAMTYAALGMPDAAATTYATAHTSYLRADHHAAASLISWLELEWVALPYRTEDIATRRRLAQRSEREHERASGALSSALPPRFVRLSLLVLEGEWEEAERIALAASAESQALIHYRLMALRHLATVSRLRGNPDQAWWAVRAVLPAGCATEPGTVWTFDIITTVQRVAVALALDVGDLPTAKAWLDTHDRWLAWSSAVLGRAEGQALWAQYQRLVGDGNQAREHAESAFVHATAPRQPLALLTAHRMLGELDTAAGRFNSADKHLETALVLADACAAPYERALTLLSFAELHARQGNQAEAVMCIETVRTICIPLGAKPTLAHTDAFAHRLRARQDPRLKYPAGLSVREVEVLQLVAAGRTNREIADHFSLSLPTINNHVAHILTKTRSANRAEAAAFAQRHGLL